MELHNRFIFIAAAASGHVRDKFMGLICGIVLLNNIYPTVYFNLLVRCLLKHLFFILTKTFVLWILAAFTIKYIVPWDYCCFHLLLCLSLLYVPLSVLVFILLHIIFIVFVVFDSLFHLLTTALISTY
jgi:hypothetical protein